MSGFHPGVTKHLAEKASEEIFDTQWTADIPQNLRPTILEETAGLIERALNVHACRAAGFAGNDPSHIYSHVWYRSDGWGHGGSAITWRERAEELEAELAVKDSLIDRAKTELEEVLRDQFDEIGGAAVNRITKLLTDIEHL